MADENINEFVNRDGVRSDKEFIVSALREVYAEFQKLEGVKIDLKGANGITALSPALQQARAGMDSLEAVTETVKKRQAELNGGSKEFTQTLLLQAKAEKELAQAQAIKDKSTQSRIKNLNDEKKVNEALTNEYLLFSKAAKEADIRAKNYSLTLGKNHPVTVQATADALAMNLKLKELDASTGTFSRNVGNYGGALVEYGKKAFGFIRIAANIIPGLGLSGAFLLIFTGISKLISAISGGEKSFNQLKQSNDALKASLASTEYTNAIKNVNDLRLNIDLAKQGFLDKKKVVEEYNETIGKTTGRVKSLDEAERELNKNAEAYIKFTLLKAAANEALTRASKEVVDQEVQNEKDREKNRKTFGVQRTNIGFDVTDAQDVGGNKSKQIILKEQQKVKELSDKRIQGFESIAQKFREDAARIAQDFKFNFFGDNKDNQKQEDEAAKKAAEIAERIRKAIFEQRKAALEEDIKINEETFKNDKLSTALRLTALREFIQEKARLIELERSFEKGQKGLLKEEVEAIEQKKQAELNQIVRDGHKEYDAIIAASGVKELQTNKSLTKLLEEGMKEKFETLKQNINDIQELRKHETDLEKQLISELTTLAFTAFNARFEREKNAIQDQIDLLEKRKQKEIEVVNASIASQQDKANQITIIEARADSQRQILEQKKRQTDIKKAQFEKAESILNIIVKTAENEVDALKYLTNPITAPLYPPIAALVGAIGAVQLATAIAQPIPRYKHGKNVSDLYEGPAIVDDGGRPEAIIRENGQIEVGTNKPRITYLKKEDIVLPDANMLIDYVLAGNMGVKLSAKEYTTTTTDFSPQILSELRSVKRAIENKKEFHFEKPSMFNEIAKMKEGNREYFKMNGL